jgi:hypothetical protein
LYAQTTILVFPADELQLKQFDTYDIMTLFVGDYYNWIEVAEMMPDV